jgi:hypothetical protein
MYDTSWIIKLRPLCAVSHGKYFEIVDRTTEQFMATELRVPLHSRNILELDKFRGLKELGLVLSGSIDR